MEDKERKAGFVTDPADKDKDKDKRKRKALRPMCDNRKWRELHNGKIGGEVNG